MQRFFSSEESQCRFYGFVLKKLVEGLCIIWSNFDLETDLFQLHEKVLWSCCCRLYEYKAPPTRVTASMKFYRSGLKITFKLATGEAHLIKEYGKGYGSVTRSFFVRRSQLKVTDGFLERLVNYNHMYTEPVFYGWGKLLPFKGTTYSWRT